MVEKIIYNDLLLAVLIRTNYKKQGVDFFTPGEFSRPKGYIIPPHVHNLIERKVTLTQEVLFIKSGKVSVDLYSQDKVHIESRVLSQGDVILLAGGGHGSEILEDAEMIEVKQRPYCGDDDKVRFEPVNSTIVNVSLAQNIAIK